MIKAVYGPKMVADQGEQGLLKVIKSPSARKPAELAQLLKNVEFVEPQPLTRDDIKLCHDPEYVDRILDLKEDNGFGNRSPEIAGSLLYTNGAMYDAARLATPEQPFCALVSGFHHAGYDNWRNFGYFCTFNGLAIAAMKLSQQGKSVAIVDCDMHWGNGTSDILNRIKSSVFHFSFGEHFTRPLDSHNYLSYLRGPLRDSLEKFAPDVIIYQAGADVHIDDPYGGIFTTDQILYRDQLMFEIAKDLGVAIAWNLAGGYQVEPDGSIQKVLDIHLNTFKACEDIYFK